MNTIVKGQSYKLAEKDAEIRKAKEDGEMKDKVIEEKEKMVEKLKKELQKDKTEDMEDSKKDQDEKEVTLDKEGHDLKRKVDQTRKKEEDANRREAEATSNIEKADKECEEEIQLWKEELAKAISIREAKRDKVVQHERKRIADIQRCREERKDVLPGLEQQWKEYMEKNAKATKDQEGDKKGEATAAMDKDTEETSVKNDAPKEETAPPEGALQTALAEMRAEMEARMRSMQLEMEGVRGEADAARQQAEHWRSQGAQLFQTATAYANAQEEEKEGLRQQIMKEKTWGEITVREAQDIAKAALSRKEPESAAPPTGGKKPAAKPSVPRSSQIAEPALTELQGQPTQKENKTDQDSVSTQGS